MPTLLITGANRGIGLEFVRQYASAGWDVVATTRDPDHAGELRDLNVRIEQLELRDFEAVTDFGSRMGDRLELLIASAGTMAPAEAESAEDGRGWAEMLMTNTIAPYLLAKAVLDQVAAARGKLIALTSGMGSISESSGGYVPYRSSKAALNMAWHSLALETRSLDIVAAVLDPGWVKTRMGGRQAPTRPEDSVADMRRLIEQLGPAESGGFFRRDGSSHAW